MMYILPKYCFWEIVHFIFPRHFPQLFFFWSFGFQVLVPYGNVYSIIRLHEVSSLYETLGGYDNAFGSIISIFL